MITYITNPNDLVAYLSIEERWGNKVYGKFCHLHTNSGGVIDSDGEIPPYILFQNGYMHSFVNQEVVDLLLKEGRIVLLKDYETGKSYGIPEK